MSQTDVGMLLYGSSILFTFVLAAFITWLAIRSTVRLFNLYVFKPRDVFEYLWHISGSYPEDIDREIAERHFRYVFIVGAIVYLASWVGISCLFRFLEIPSIFFR